MKLSLALFVVLIVAQPAWALPRFASRTANRCQACHVNPSGAGMRQPFGVQYGREELPVPTWSDDLALEDFSTDLNKFVSIGADFRTIYYWQQNPPVNPPLKTVDHFFQMQGDLYTQFRIAKKVSVYIDKGLYAGFEVFGLLGVLPENGFIKVGKFVPNFGTKLDDHRAFIRTITGFSAEQGHPELTGGEVAIAPGPVTITGGLYNAVDISGLANENRKAALGRVDGTFKLSEDMHLSIGGNVYTGLAPTGLAPTRQRTTYLGGFGAITYQNLTVFGEADVIKMKGPGVPATGLVTYVEADYVVTPGLDLKFAYDFYDPDTDLKSGSFARFTFGFEFFPVTGVEVRPLYHVFKEQPASAEFKNDEFQVMLHFFI